MVCPRHLTTSGAFSLFSSFFSIPLTPPEQQGGMVPTAAAKGLTHYLLRSTPDVVSDDTGWWSAVKSLCKKRA